VIIGGIAVISMLLSVGGFNRQGFDRDEVVLSAVPKPPPSAGMPEPDLPGCVDKCIIRYENDDDCAAQCALECVINPEFDPVESYCGLCGECAVEICVGKKSGSSSLSQCDRVGFCDAGIGALCDPEDILKGYSCFCNYSPP
jgi:hypothetical protein